MEEDFRRLFQECKIGRGNASLLVDAIAHGGQGDIIKVIDERSNSLGCFVDAMLRSSIRNVGCRKS